MDLVLFYKIHHNQSSTKNLFGVESALSFMPMLWVCINAI